MSKSIVLAADPSWLASLRLRSGAHLRRANSAPVLAAPRDPGGSTAIFDRFTHSRALRTDGFRVSTTFRKGLRAGISPPSLLELFERFGPVLFQQPR